MFFLKNDNENFYLEYYNGEVIFRIKDIGTNIPKTVKNLLFILKKINGKKQVLKHVNLKDILLKINYFNETMYLEITNGLTISYEIKNYQSMFNLLTVLVCLICFNNQLQKILYYYKKYFIFDGQPGFPLYSFNIHLFEQFYKEIILLVR